MAGNRITPGGAVRRGLALILAALALAAALSACGGGGESDSASSPEARAADGEVLNQILARQLGVVAAYRKAMIVIDARTLALLRKFRAQEGEHADAVVKSLRGLGQEVEAEPEAIESGDLKTRDERLRFAYQLESSTIEAEVTAIAKLESHAARAMLATTVGNQAEHLAILRRLLGAPPLEAVPEAFVTGSTPAPPPTGQETGEKNNKTSVR